jgi:hypothetical protein
MPADDQLQAGTQLQLDIENKAVTYDGLVDIGFTRNFAPSQAYRDQFGNNPDIISADAKDGLGFEKSTLKNKRGESVYSWLGFEAHALLFDFLRRADADNELTLDVMAYDLNERDIVAAIESFGPRLRAIVDDSSGDDNPHNAPDSTESRSADRFIAAGGQVKRTHFHNLQHNKVFITRRNGIPEAVLCGSTNFTYRGLSSRPTTCWCSAHPTSRRCTARCPTLRSPARRRFATPTSPRPGTSSHDQQTDDPAVLFTPSRNRLVPQPDSRSGRPSHLLGAVFGGVSQPDDQGTDRRGVPPADQPARLQLRNGRQTRQTRAVEARR